MRIYIASFILTLGHQLVTFAVPSSHPAQPRLLLIRDPKLQRRAETDVPGRAISSLLSEVTEATGIELSADQRCGDHKIIYYSKSRTVGETLDILRDHFEFQWVSIPNRVPGTTTLGYRLVMSRERQQTGDQLRAQAERERIQRLSQRLEKRLRFLNASRETLQHIGANDPYFDPDPPTPRLRARLQLVSSLPPGDRYQVVAGQPYVSQSLAQMPSSLRETALLAGGLMNRSVDPSQLRFTFRRDSVDGADHLTVQIIGPDGRPVGSSSDVVPTDSPRREAAISGIPYATDPRRKSADRFFEKTAELLDEKGQPLLIQAGLPVLLEGVARATGLDVLSDYYAGQTLRFEKAPLGKRPLWQLLNIVAEQHCLRWERRGNILLFRHREWYEIEPEEIPERLLRAFYTKKPNTEWATPKELFDLLAVLTPAQLHGLRFQFRRLLVVAPYSWERWLASLDARQRAALVEGQVLSGGDLTRTSNAQLAALFPPGIGVRTEAIQIKARVEHQSISITASANGQNAAWHWQIPPKMTAPLPISLKMQSGR